MFQYWMLGLWSRKPDGEDEWGWAQKTGNRNKRSIQPPIQSVHYSQDSPLRWKEKGCFLVGKGKDIFFSTLRRNSWSDPNMLHIPKYLTQPQENCSDGKIRRHQRVAGYLLIFNNNKFHVYQCQAQIEIWCSPDVHLTTIWPSPDPQQTLN